MIALLCKQTARAVAYFLPGQKLALKDGPVDPAADAAAAAEISAAESTRRGLRDALNLINDVLADMADPGGLTAAQMRAIQYSKDALDCIDKLVHGTTNGPPYSPVERPLQSPGVQPSLAARCIDTVSPGLCVSAAKVFQAHRGVATDGMEPVVTADDAKAVDIEGARNKQRAGRAAVADPAHEAAAEEIIIDTLNDEQKLIFDKIVAATRAHAAGDSPKERLFFVHGPPGSGKSHVIKAVRQQVRLDGNRSMCATPTGITAVNLQDAVTLHSLFNLGFCGGKDDSKGAGGRRRRQPIEPGVRSTAKVHLSTIFKNVSVLIVDELSFVRASDFFDISEQLNAALPQRGGGQRDPNYSFGGLIVFCLGDFFQLPAPGIGAVPLFVAAVRLYCPALATLNPPKSRGKDADKNQVDKRAVKGAPAAKHLEGQYCAPAQCCAYLTPFAAHIRWDRRGRYEEQEQQGRGAVLPVLHLAVHAPGALQGRRSYRLPR